MRVLYGNARVRTMDADLPSASELLVDGDRIVAVGDSLPRSGGVEVVDLDGRWLVPGLHDAHTHLLYAGTRFTRHALIPEGAGPQEVVDVLRAHADSSGAGADEWLVGGRVNPLNFPAGLDRAFLDEAFPDRPVYLYQQAVHHGLANGRALELAGLTPQSVDPHGGTLVRRPGTDELSGVLVERATWPVVAAFPDPSDEDVDQAVRWAVAQNLANGITSVQEASASPRLLRSLLRLEAAGQLDLRVSAHLVWREEAWGLASAQELDDTIVGRARFANAMVTTDAVKIWLDGSPMPPYVTASSLDDEGHASRDELLFERAELFEAMRRFDRDGIRMKIHCAGDGAVRTALDVLERVRGANGEDGPWHEIAHCSYVSETDLGRFHRLRVVAELSPPVWADPAYRDALRGSFRFASLDAAGALMTVGTDWGVTPRPELFSALEGITEHAAESLDIETAWRCATSNGAVAVNAIADRGTLTAGKLADFVVLDRDPMSVGQGALSGAQVLRTVLGGRTVFDRDQEHP